MSCYIDFLPSNTTSMESCIPVLLTTVSPFEFTPENLNLLYKNRISVLLGSIKL